jgi:hypothetical protein
MTDAEQMIVHARERDKLNAKRRATRATSTGERQARQIQGGPEAAHQRFNPARYPIGLKPDPRGWQTAALMR